MLLLSRTTTGFIAASLHRDKMMPTITTARAEVTSAENGVVVIRVAATVEESPPRPDDVGVSVSVSVSVSLLFVGFRSLP